MLGAGIALDVPAEPGETLDETVQSLLRDLGDQPAGRALDGASRKGDESTGLLGRFLESLPRAEQPNFWFRLLRRFQTPVRERVGGPQRDLPAGDRPVAVGPGSPATVLLARPGEAPRVADERVAGVYPEWDDQLRAYRMDWCTVLDVLEPDHTSDLSPGIADGTLRRRLARLGLGLERCRRRYQGDEVVVDAAVEMRVQLAVGSSPDENVYLEDVRRHRDLAVLVLLDVSGSSAEPSPYGARVHDHQRSAAAALVEALYQLGDRVACYAFYSRGRAEIRMVRAKSFDEPFGGLVLQRLGGLKPRGFTRLGAAIRHATRLLERDSGVTRRVLVVLSDGQPYDFHQYEGAYGEADVRRALAEARRRGVGSLCLTIGAAGDAEALRRVFGATAYASAGDLYEIRDEIGLLFRHALRLGERVGSFRSSLPATEGR